MKKLTFISLAIVIVFGNNITASAQDTYLQTPIYSEKYGNALNLGIGLGYYNYVGHSIAAFHADYEFDVARCFTLAPFINYYSFQDYNYWGDFHNPYRYYYYRETVIPVGIKGSYYLDRLLNINKRWDLYAAASLGFTIRNTTWENGYYGQTAINEGAGPLFMDLHIGGEYHVNRKIGIFLDLSTGVSTLGLGFHF